MQQSLIEKKVDTGLSGVLDIRVGAQKGVHQRILKPPKAPDLKHARFQ